MIYVSPTFSLHCLGVLRETLRLSGGCVPFHPSAIADVFNALGDLHSHRVWRTLKAERVDLHVFGRERFEAMLEGIPDGYWPEDTRSKPLNGLYLREGARNPLDPAKGLLMRGAIFLAVPSANLPAWAEPEEVLFEALAVAVHEHKHHLDSPFDFSRDELEKRALDSEARWRAKHTLRDGPP